MYVIKRIKKKTALLKTNFTGCSGVLVTMKLCLIVLISVFTFGLRTSET